jgi:3-oxoacyl-[acyl-carrier-protein] synthase II
MYKKTKVVVTGLGVVTPLGSNTKDLWNSLLNKECAARHWDDLEQQEFRITVACRIPGLHASPMKRGTVLALQAAQSAVEDAAIQLPKNTGVLVGSTIGESFAFERAAEGGDVDLSVHTTACFAKVIKHHFVLNGPARAYGTACVAGNYAIGAAADMLQRGLIDAAIAGGVDPFSRIAMTGFSRSRAMSQNGTCSPFDEKRNGMILGEGAAFLILEIEKDAVKRGAFPLATIGTQGLSCDAYHATAPSQDGSGLANALSSALFQDKLQPSNIDWICAHGSGTQLSDKTEALAINKVLGSNVPVSGIKGALGHTLGAATAIETVVCVLALQHQVIPPTTNLENIDPEIQIKAVKEPTKARIRRIINNGLAFGGLNSALIIGEWS